ncbi:MAG: WbqC family protein [Aphanothece saxicola GSE-SYN-MK-01-06B]|jgi:hypothetical protein|nr:WbqC family protein [Aphanothece saxicola GSE-SYN-MK-01-06B]
MYFPWVGFMAQMALADVLIWLDDAQFSKGSFTNRVQVRYGETTKWMTIPLVRSASFPRIMDLGLPGEDIFQAHRSLLAQSLRGRPFRQQALRVFDEAMASDSLLDRLIASAEVSADRWGILPARRLRSSTMGIDGTSWNRVLHLVQAVGGTRYITGHGAAGYLCHEAFDAASIRVEYMVYDPVPWDQVDDFFTPYVANLDLYASVDPRRAREHLRPGVLGWREHLRSLR